MAKEKACCGNCVSWDELWAYGNPLDAGICNHNGPKKAHRDDICPDYEGDGVKPAKQAEKKKFLGLF